MRPFVERGASRCRLYGEKDWLPDGRWDQERGLTMPMRGGNGGGKKVQPHPLWARQRRSWAGGESTEQAEGRRGHRRMHQWGSRYTPGGLGRSGKVGRGARLLGSQYQSAPACDLPQAQLFRLWRVASTEWPRPRGQEAVLLALPPARSGASSGCKEAAGSGAAALVTGSRRWPEHGPRLPAAFRVANFVPESSSP